MKDEFKNIRRIFFDDDRPTPEGWTQFRTSGQMFYFLMHNDIEHFVDVLSFDHDLGESSISAYEMIKQVIDERPEAFNYVGEVRFHTNNIVGGRNMYHILKNAQEQHVISPDLHINSTIYQYDDKKLLTTPFVWDN